MHEPECRANATSCTDPRCVFRTKGVPVFENYMRLVMYAFGFESAWKRHGLVPGDMFFVKVRAVYMAWYLYCGVFTRSLLVLAIRYGRRQAPC